MVKSGRAFRTVRTVDATVSALFGATRQAMLRLLFTHPDQRFYQRQIILLVRLGSGTVQRELEQFAAAGIITRTAVRDGLARLKDPVATGTEKSDSDTDVMAGFECRLISAAFSLHRNPYPKNPRRPAWEDAGA